MSYDVLISIGFGLMGGVVRGVVGLFKALAYRRKIYWSYWLVTSIVSGLIGALTGSIFSFDYRLSVLAGYAGTDILEGIYKSFKVEKVYIKSR